MLMKKPDMKSLRNLVCLFWYGMLVFNDLQLDKQVYNGFQNWFWHTRWKHQIVEHVVLQKDTIQNLVFECVCILENLLMKHKVREAKQALLRMDGMLQLI
jgi:hypothetical protein